MTDFIDNKMPKFWTKHFSPGGDGYGTDVFTLDPETVPGPLFTRFMAEDIRDLADAISGIQQRVLSLEGGGSTGLSSSLMGSYASYEVYAGSGTTGAAAGDTVNGDMGNGSAGSPNGGAFPATISNGSAHSAVQATVGAAALAAQSTLNSYGVTTDRTATNDLANQVLFPGVYKFTSTTCAISAGTLTLDAQGNPNAQFIFNVGTALTTAASTSVILQNGARAENVIWNLGTAATLGASSVFKGSIFAGSAITVGLGASVRGRLMAQTSVTLNGSNILDHLS